MQSFYEYPRKNENEPLYSTCLSQYGQITAVHFSPYEWSQNIILIAFPSKILVGHITIDVC